MQQVYLFMCILEGSHKIVFSLEANQHNEGVYFHSAEITVVILFPAALSSMICFIPTGVLQLNHAHLPAEGISCIMR